MIGRSIFDFIHPDDIERIAEGVAQIYQGRIEPLEFRVIDKDGSERFVRTSGRVVEEKGQVVGIGGIMTDLTELRHVEEGTEDARQAFAIRQAAERAAGS